MQSLKQLWMEYQKADTGERLGQYFVNRYIKKPWPELFYCDSDVVAYVEITDWLRDNQYLDGLPQKINNI